MSHLLKEWKFLDSYCFCISSCTIIIGDLLVYCFRHGGVLSNLDLSHFSCTFLSFFLNRSLAGLFCRTRGASRASLTCICLKITTLLHQFRKIALLYTSWFETYYSILLLVLVLLLTELQLFRGVCFCRWVICFTHIS